jgi:subtilisin
MKRFVFFLVLAAGVLFFTGSDSPAYTAIAKDVVPGKYIVVLKDTGEPSRALPEVAGEMARAYGLTVGHLYSAAIKGYSAAVPIQRLGELRADRRVKYVAVDKVVYASPRPPDAGKPSGNDKTPPPPQQLPTGVDRIDAELNLGNTAAGIGVAIIDTGIDLKHDDLKANIRGNVTFVRGTRSGNDDNGHGTHVAGIVAALDNDIGVVGVAPDAGLYAVKVLNKQGTGYLSDVVAGVDWVTANAGDISVANMSLSGAGTDDDPADPLHEAIRNSVAAGITYVAAAGNAGTDAAETIPACYDEVITVSAIVDTDGRGGGLGSPTGYGDDDSFASFSNFGGDVDLAAPGVNILSTWKGNGYNTISGTSMAAPHAAGAAALYISSQLDMGNTPTPAEVRAALIEAGTLQTEPDGFSGDPDEFAEPLVDAEGL